MAFDEERSHSIDTHFHSNIFYLPKGLRIRKMKGLRHAIGHLDILCSTEHAYKDPLSAYDFLIEVCANFDLETEIVPGVENISREGVELIFLTESRAHLLGVLKDMPAFGWSIYDTEDILQTGAVTIVPHPFSPSKTGMVSGVGLDAALTLMQQHHYVEVCNGAFLNPIFSNFGTPSLRRKIHYSAEYPDEHRFQGMTGSIGSDAHGLDDLNCFGKLRNYDSTMTAFRNLKNRKEMTKVVRQSSNSLISKAASALSITGVEAVHKRSLRVLNR